MLVGVQCWLVDWLAGWLGRLIWMVGFVLLVGGWSVGWCLVDCVGGWIVGGLVGLLLVDWSPG